MPTTAVGNTSGESVAELIQNLKSDLANGIAAGRPPGTGKTGATDSSRDMAALARAVQNPPPAVQPVGDVASVLLSQVATSDMTKLIQILDPVPDPSSDKVLGSLLHQAVQEVANGNSGRAIGYLADYATRDPRLAETLPFQPGLEPVRDNIDSMVNRMASVAKMTAEDGLSRAEQASTEVSGKLNNWDTGADVLVKLAQHLYDAGGYANYSRSAEISKLISDAGTQVKAQHQALAAAASATVSASVASQGVTEMLPGINVPYWVNSEIPIARTYSNSRVAKPRRTSATSALDDLRENLAVLKQIAGAAVLQLWLRAPLLVMLLGWLSFGVAGGVVFATVSRIWPESPFVAIGNLGFTLWALGFLAMVGFSVYARLRYRR